MSRSCQIPFHLRKIYSRTGFSSGAVVFYIGRLKLKHALHVNRLSGFLQEGIFFHLIRTSVLIEG